MARVRVGRGPIRGPIYGARLKPYAEVAAPDPAIQRAASPLDRCRLLADCELRVGEGQVGAEFEGELLGVLCGIDRALGLGVANGCLEQPRATRP